MKSMYFYRHILLCKTHAWELKNAFMERNMKDEVAEIRQSKEADTANCYCCLKQINPREAFGL